MKLQLALDLVNIQGAIELVKEVEEHIDVVEIGTPVVINEGLKAVKEVKAAFPNLTVLADLKIMDAAGYEVSQASAAGADIIAVKDIAARAKELDELGVDYICVHTGYDLQAVGKNSFEDLSTIKSVVKNAQTTIAGGHIDYIERNIISDPLTVNEIKSILRLTEDGTNDIISIQSKIFQELNINVESLSLNEFYNLIMKYPQMLRRPIIQDEKRLQVGYSEEEIRRFLPRKVRNSLNTQLQKVAN